MASRTERTTNLLGGMQLLPPSDKLNEGNSLLTQNFRVDQNNQLLSRNGTSLRFGPYGSGVFHTVKRQGNNEYLGIGAELFQQSSSSAIAGGFDGQPLGVAFMNKAAWVMNQAKRVKTYGVDPLNWGIAAPTSAPSATGGDQVTTLIDEWESGPITVVVHAANTEDGNFTKKLMDEGAPVESDLGKAEFGDIDGAPSGGVLKITANSALAIKAYTKKGINTYVDGMAQDEDLIRVWVFVSDPKVIETITVYVKSGDTGYAEYAFTDPQKFLSQAVNSWTQLKIRRHLNLDDFQGRITKATTEGNQTTISDLESQFATAIQTPTFVYTGSGWPQTGIGGAPPSSYPPSEAMLAVDWAAISEFGVSFKTKAACQVAIDRAETAGTVGANSTGAVTYWYSNVTLNLEDSNPSPASNPVVVGTQTVTLNGISPSPDPSTAFRWIWRSGGGLSQPLRVGILFDNSTTTWKDTTTNRIAQRDNVLMPSDHDLPPAALGVIGPIYGKLIAFNTLDHPSRFFWTPAGRPWYFPGANDDAVGNWEDAGSDDDQILAATDHRPMTILYKERSIWVLSGDPEDNDPKQSNAHIGIFGPKAVCKVGGVDYLAGSEGIYSFNGDSEEKLSAAIDPIFKQDFVQLSDGTYLYPISLDNAGNSVIEAIGDRLYFSYPEQGHTQPNVTAVLHRDTGRWTREVYNLRAAGFTCMLNEGYKRGFVGGVTGSDGGYLYRLNNKGIFLDDGQPARAIWQSRYQDQDLPNNFKIYADLEIDCATRTDQSPNSPLTVSAIFDNGTIVALGTISSPSATKPRFTATLRIPSGNPDIPVGRKAKNVSIRIEGDILGEIKIFGVYLHWYPEERVARSFDSGPTALGIPERVKQIDHMEIYQTAAGQTLARVLQSDLPGNLLTGRLSDTFSAPAGRGTVKQRLGIVEGRNFRLTLSDSPANSSTFQVHQVRLRCRVIGEYVDGTTNPGEYYESPEFSVEPGRVGEAKDLLLDYDVSGPGGRIEIYSDLPGSGMALRRTVALPAHTTRAVEPFAFEDPTVTGPYAGVTLLPYGQLFRVRIYPPAGGILRLHGRATIRVRLIGTFFDGSKGEIWETQPINLLDGMGLFREMEITAATSGPMYLEMLTELPGHLMRTAARMLVPSGTDSRGPIRARLPGPTKGQLQQFRLVGPYVARVFDVRVLGRKTQLTGGDWNWIPVPFERTGNAWTDVNMPVRATPAEFTWIDLPVDSIE